MRWGAQRRRAPTGWARCPGVRHRQGTGTGEDLGQITGDIRGQVLDDEYFEQVL